MQPPRKRYWIYAFILLNPPSFAWLILLILLAVTRWSRTYDQHREPFHFLPTTPDVLFCKGSPPMKKVIMTVQPDLLQSAFKRRQASTVVAPRVLTKKRKMITRRVIKKPAPTSSSPSESNTNQVTYFSETSSLSYTCVLWLTAVLCSGCSWRNP